MNYASLVADHVAIDRYVQQLLDLARAKEAHPAVAALTLGMLATALRDHFAAEDIVVCATIAATRGGRHAQAALASQSGLADLRTEWAGYLDRWDDVRIAADWSEFSAESVSLLEPFGERMNRETAILYSLAVHYEVIGIN